MLQSATPSRRALERPSTSSGRGGRSGTGDERGQSVGDEAPPRCPSQSPRPLARNPLLACDPGRDLRRAVARGDHQRGADRWPVRSVARSHTRTGRNRLARACGVLRPRRLCRGDSGQQGLRRPDARPRLGRRRRRGRRPRHRAPPAARRRPDAADGDAGRLAHARRARQPQRLAHWRRRRPELFDCAGARPVPDRFHRTAQRGALQLCRPLHPVYDRPPPRAVALRAGARGDPREPPARRRARHRHQPAHRCDLCGFGGLCGRSRRAARPDNADRLARPVRLPPLGRRHADAHHRRRGISLWRPHRRGRRHRVEGRDFRRDARILGILDRPRPGHPGARRPRADRRSAPAADRPFRAPRRAPRRRVIAPALEARGLARNFGALIATDDVSFAVQPGARQALIGPNGAGKTTLINLLTGVIRPTAGQVWLAGRDVTHLSANRRVRLGLTRTFQINQLFPDLTPAESLGLAISERNGFGADFWRVAGNQPAIVAEIEDLLTRFGLEAELDQPTRKLAYGKQRLLEIALALAARPRVLLLDEPAAGVPEEERQDILAALAALPADVAILLIEHDMDLVFSFASRISVLVAGRLLTEGAPEEIAADERVRAVYLGEDAHG